MSNSLDIRDQKILELFSSGLSPDEVESAMGIPAAKALMRAKEILASRDVFDVAEERRLLIGRFDALYQQGKALLDSTGVKDWPRGVEALTKLLKEIRETKTVEEYKSDKELREIAKSQAAIFGDVVRLSFDRVTDHIAERYPEVDITELNDIFEKGAREIAASYSS